MPIQLQPPPINDKADSVAWKDWYFKFQKKFTTLKHNDLNDIQGGVATGDGQRYHLDALQWEQSRSWRSIDSTDAPVAINPDTSSVVFILSNGNLTAQINPLLPDTVASRSAICNTAISGKRYWEVVWTTTNQFNTTVGMTDSGLDWNNFAVGKDTTVGVENWCSQMEQSLHSIRYRNVQENFTNPGGTLMFAVDTDAENWWAGVNGVWQQSGDPANGTNPINTTPFVGTQFPGIGVFRYGGIVESRTWTFQFTTDSWTYTAPAGFSEIPPNVGVQDDSFFIPLEGGDSVILPGGLDWSGRHLAVKKVDSTTLTASILLGAGDSFEDGSPILTLTAPYQGFVFQKRNQVWHILSQFTEATDVLALSKRYSLLVS